jgi:hypothetical protein
VAGSAGGGMRRRRGGDDRGGSEQGRKAPWWGPRRIAEPPRPLQIWRIWGRRDFPVLQQGRRSRRQNGKILLQEGILGFWRCRCGKSNTIWRLQLVLNFLPLVPVQRPMTNGYIFSSGGLIFNDKFESLGVLYFRN